MPKRYFKGAIIALVIIVGFIRTGWSQSLNYQEVFGRDWEKAMSFVSENKNWMEPVLNKFHISYPTAVAVVFPELVRYSAVRDKIEITLLKTLYINLGEEYANFSIGQFQMKPSFAEKIRKKANSVMGRKSKSLFSNKREYTDIRKYRAAIVADLEDPKTEFNYLIAFFKICESSFDMKQRDEDSRLKFLATAYNYGFYRNAEQIESMTDKKFFNTKVFKTENYSYADVSLYWYNQYIKDKNGYNK